MNRFFFGATAIIAATALAPAMAEPAAYEFDTTHTTIRASWNHQGYSRQSLDFTKYTGILMLDFDKPENSKIEVDFALDGGIWAGAPESDRFETHLSSADFFDFAKFPTAKFKSTSIVKTGETTGKMTGDLTMRGQTHPVTLDVTLNKRGDSRGRPKAGLSAKGVIDRSQWGMGFAAPLIPNEIDLSIETELLGAAPAKAE